MLNTANAWVPNIIEHGPAVDPAIVGGFRSLQKQEDLRVSVTSTAAELHP